METNVVFVGAGAVGCFYASRLYHPARNLQVSLIARSNYRAIKESGVQLLTHSFGDYHFTPKNIYASIAEAAKDPLVKRWDFIVVTTKALPDLQDDSLSIAPLVKDRDTAIVIIQNGVGVEAPFRARFPANPIISAVTVISSEQISHGVVRQNRWTRISLGPYLQGPSGASVAAEEENTKQKSDQSLLNRTNAALQNLQHWWGEYGGIRDVEAHDEVDLQLIRWHKLCINAAMNPSAVLSGGRGNADMVRDAELRIHLHGIMDEIRAAVGKILGREFPESLASAERILQSSERNTGARPSMLLDWEAGRPMELEVILGNPVRMAREKGVALPRVQTLYALLKSAQETRVREKQQAKEKL